MPPYAIGGINKDDPIGITCNKLGYMTMISNDGSRLIVKTYYSSQGDGTIISPTAVVRQHSDKYSGWIQILIRLFDEYVKCRIDP